MVVNRSNFIRKLIGAAVLTIAALATFNNTASAQAAMPADSHGITIIQILNPEPIPPPIVQEAEPKPEPEKKKPKVKKYQAVAGDSLIKIGKKHKTDWKRIWAANKSLKHQDQLKVGQVIVIPETDAKLKARKLIEARQAVVSAAVGNVSGSIANTPQQAVHGSYANDMDYGYCTHWAKSQRPDLPTGLGNANTWYSRAASMGLAVGSTPAVGAVATTTRGAYGHVAIVEKVEGGKIYVSEKNVRGWNVLSYAWYPASDYLYIY